MRVAVQYRTEHVEKFVQMPDFWYVGDNQEFYVSPEDAEQNSEIIKDYRCGEPTDLTVVRLIDETGKVVRYINPNPIKQ